MVVAQDQPQAQKLVPIAEVNDMPFLGKGPLDQMPPQQAQPQYARGGPMPQPGQMQKMQQEMLGKAAEKTFSLGANQLAASANPCLLYTSPSPRD